MQYREVPGSNLIRSSAELRDPTSLRGSRWPSVRNKLNAVINIGVDCDPKLAVGQLKLQLKKFMFPFFLHVILINNCLLFTFVLLQKILICCYQEVTFNNKKLFRKVLITFSAITIIKVGLQPSKKNFVLFSSLKALWKWWKMLFISS